MPKILSIHRRCGNSCERGQRKAGKKGFDVEVLTTDLSRKLIKKVKRFKSWAPNEACYSAPNRLLEYPALGKVVVTTLLPEIVLTAKDLVNFAVTSKEYVDVIEDYNRGRKRYLEKAKKGPSFAMQLTWAKIAQKYEQLLVSFENY